MATIEHERFTAEHLRMLRQEGLTSERGHRLLEGSSLDRALLQGIEDAEVLARLEETRCPGCISRLETIRSLRAQARKERP